MLKFILWPFTAKQDGDVNGNERYATDNSECLKYGEITVNV